MISKSLLLMAIIIPVILGILFLASNLIDNKQVDNKIRIQLIREEVRLVSFGAVENLGAEKRDVLIIDNDGNMLFTPEVGYGVQERRSISINDLKRVKSFILDSGLLSIEDEFSPDHLPERFVRYTLIINIDNSNKRFQWVEANDESEPSRTPPILIRLKDTIYCIADKAEVYGIICS